MADDTNDSGTTDNAASVAALDTGLDQLAELVATVGPDDLDKPTPCTDWQVRDLVDHVLHSTAGMAKAARGEQVDWSAPTPHADDPVAAFGERAQELRTVMADAGEAANADWQLAELATHTWDLATALGRSTSDLDPVVAERGLGFMSAQLTDDKRGEAFQPEQQAPAGADAYQRIAAFAGRSV
jgi:uncharacterized protein (TIGR03086 family)